MPIGGRARAVGQVDCSLDGDSASSTRASAPETVDGSWPSTQFDVQNTGFNPDAAGPADCPRKLWQLRVSPDEFTREINYSIMTSPVIHDGTLYVCDNENALYALDAATGSVQWTMGLRGWYIYGPVYANGSLYLTSDRHLLGIDVEERTEQWARVEPSPQRTIDITKQSWIGGGIPAVHNNRVFAGTAHGLFCAFDAGTGELLWYKDIPKRCAPLGGEGRPCGPQSQTTPRSVFSGQPAVDDGVVYVANQNGRLYALDAETGVEHWVHQPGDRLDYAPTVSGDTVYVTGAGGIYAISRGDGTREWTYGRANDQITRSSPAIVGDTLVAVAGPDQEHRKLVAIDTQTGESRWQTLASTSWGSSPSIAGETVVMGMRDGLLAVELSSGKPRWTARSEEVTSEPVLVDDMVFAADSDGFIYALR